MSRTTQVLGSMLVLTGAVTLARADVIAHYRADGNCLDVAGAHHGTPQNGAGFGVGVAGQAFELDGTNQYISAPDSADWHFAGGPFSISVWVNFDVVKQGPVGLLPNVLVGQDDGGGTQDKWVFFCDGAAQPWFHVNGPNYAFISPGFGPLNYTGWHHYAMTREGNFFRFYVDAIDVGTVELAVTIPDSSLGLSIGQAEGLGYLDGRIDDVQIYDRALTPSEIAVMNTYPGVQMWPTGCPGDLNADGSVDGADLGVLLGQWGNCNVCSADLNDDDVVDGADLGVILGAWGACGS